MSNLIRCHGDSDVKNNLWFHQLTEKKQGYFLMKKMCGLIKFKKIILFKIM